MSKDTPVRDEVDAGAEPNPDAAIETAPKVEDDEGEPPHRGIRRVEEPHYVTKVVAREFPPQNVNMRKGPEGNVDYRIKPYSRGPAKAVMRTLSDLEPGKPLTGGARVPKKPTQSTKKEGEPE